MNAEQFTIVNITSTYPAEESTSSDTFVMLDYDILEFDDGLKVSLKFEEVNLDESKTDEKSDEKSAEKALDEESVNSDDDEEARFRLATECTNLLIAENMTKAVEILLKKKLNNEDSKFLEFLAP